MQFIRRLIGVGEKTVPASFSEDADDGREDNPHSRFGWATDVGAARSNNEDSVLVVTAVQEGQHVSPDFEFFVVADGMGGHRAGEVASSIAARTVTEYVTRHFYLPNLTASEHGTDEQPLNEILIQAVRSANQMVLEHVPGAGTTLTCALLIGRKAYIAHVGDSRAYILQNGMSELITQDHSLVDRLVELGQLTRDEAGEHPQKNVLYRAIGQSGVLEVDTAIRSIPNGARLLICTDGLWGMISDADIAQIVTDYRVPQIACDRLVLAANRAGGRDNITAVIAVPRSFN